MRSEPKVWTLLPVLPPAGLPCGHRALGGGCCSAAALWHLSWGCPRLWVLLEVLVEGGGGSARCWVSAEQEEALNWNTRLRS